jgi:uncharacterized tellurite resistance protein B-like protein
MAGGPLGGLLGFAAAQVFDDTSAESVKESVGASSSSAKYISEKEASLLIIGSHAARADGIPGLEEIQFIRNFLIHHFGPSHIEERMGVTHHVLQKEYDLLKACDHTRIYMSEAERMQLMHFLFQLCGCDAPLSEKEERFLWKITGWLGFNDKHFRELARYYMDNAEPDARSILGVQPGDGPELIRKAYRQYVLRFHPDRMPGISVDERKRLEEQLMRVKAAYESLKKEMGFR